MAKKLLSFIKRERLYIIILLFLISVQILFIYAEKKTRSRESHQTKSSALNLLDEDLKLREKFIDSITKGKNTFAIVVLFCFIIGAVLGFILGLALLMFFLIRHLSGVTLIKPFLEKQIINWSIIDVLKISILFLFFGYAVHIAEAFYIWLFRIKTFDTNLFALINTAFIDIAGLFLIIYFVSVKHRQRLISLGITLKNFAREIWVGLLGYIAFIPILISIFIIVIVIVNITNYKPQPQPIFEIFFEEKRTNVLTSLIILISIIGPITEEMFFRGFAYSALKRRFGVVFAALVSSSVFALLHANIVGFFPIMSLGLLLTYLYEKSGSLIPSITVHTLHNSILAVFMLAIKEFTGML